MIERDAILKALSNVMDPDLRRDIVSLGMVKDVQIRDNGDVRVQIALTTPACPLKDTIRRNAEAALRGIEGIGQVLVEMTSQVRSGRQQAKEVRLPGVRNIIAVGSGKGGVGKSTVAANIAVALGQTGAKVGLLDADLYGPSVPILLGLHGAVPKVEKRGDREVLVPVHKYDLEVMSIGFLLKDSDAVAWRGPMLHRALQQFLDDVEWGELDYLIVDLPPGTGDVQLSLAQLVPVSSAVVVTTPQDVAVADVKRALRMFELTRVPVLGVVENMATFVCPSCGAEHRVFGGRPIEERLRDLGIESLGSVPLQTEVAELGDSGLPVVVGLPESRSAQAFREIASKVAAGQSILSFEAATPRPGAQDSSSRDTHG